MLDKSDKGKTPLEKSLDKLGKIISLFVLGVAAIIFIMGAFVRGGGILKNFMTAVAVAVAAIPEGLPAVVTIIMAMGVQRMSGENVVIRKLKCVETLGGCTCICTDKTGTLTLNNMRAVKVYANFKETLPSTIESDMFLIKACAAICTDVKGERGAYVGDPTEIALKNFAQDFSAEYEVKDKVPFTSERKLMSVSARCEGATRLYVKGAPDVLLQRCDKAVFRGEAVDLTESARQTILRENDKMSGEALRVLAFAVREGDGVEEEGLTFLGLIGLADGLKRGVKDAVAECARAGVTTVMITGDHARTAFAVAKQAGIADDMSQVVTGEQLDAMSKSQRTKAVKGGRVFARVTPAHKNIIVKLKKSAGEVVAMTGDGVNDAPPIKSADIGIAMGVSGTDVTKSVADMVIADDNFTTIVTAVREGRRIFANIKKTIQFFLSTNLAEVLSVLIAALVFCKNDFLLSTQLLWINLITDSFPVLALGTEQGDFGAMSRPPERAEKSLFSKSSIFVILLSGLYISGVTVGVYAFALLNFGNETATTMTFLTVSFLELFHAFNVRSESLSVFKRGEPVNKILLITVAVGVAVNVALALSPFKSVFGLVDLSGAQWGIVALLSLSVIPFGELYKFFLRLAERKVSRKMQPREI
jgi:Ca2+-transporting ATPase